MMKLLAIAALVFGTCAFAPDGAIPIAAPPHWREVWKQAEDCSGKKGDFERVSWHIIPGPDFPCKNGRCIGEWTPPHSISIASGFMNTDWVVRHEILHDLVGRHYPGDTLLWGVACKATWGYLESDDPSYVP